MQKSKEMIQSKELVIDIKLILNLALWFLYVQHINDCLLWIDLCDKYFLSRCTSFCPDPSVINRLTSEVIMLSVIAFHHTS